MIVVIFLIIENKLLIFTSIWTRRALVYITITCCISQLILITNNLQPFLNGFSGPGIPIGQYEKDGISEVITLASKACDLDPINGKFIVTDDLTYGYFRKSQGPILLTYLYLVDSRSEVFEYFFNEVNSSGIIARCESIPIKDRIKFTTTNKICCLSRNEFLKINTK